MALFFLAVLYLISTARCIKSRKSNQVRCIFHSSGYVLQPSRDNKVTVNCSGRTKAFSRLGEMLRAVVAKQRWCRGSGKGCASSSGSSMPVCKHGRGSSGPAEKVVIIIIPSLSTPLHSFLASLPVCPAASSSHHPVLPASLQLLWRGALLEGVNLPQLGPATCFPTNTFQG